VSLAFDVLGTYESKHTAAIRFDGEQVGQLVYSEFPEMTVVYQLAVQPERDVPAIRQAVITRLTERFSGPDAPNDYIHVGVFDASVLFDYLASPLARGAVVTGSINSQIYYHDRLVEVDPADIQAAVNESDLGGTGVVLSWSRDLEVLDQIAKLDDAALHRLLRSRTSSARIGALRALSHSLETATRTCERVFMYSLLDSNYEVRRFASVTMHGFFPGVEWYPPMRLLFDHMRDPLRSLREFSSELAMPDGEVFSPEHGSRNKRYALLWTLGNLTGWGGETERFNAWKATEWPTRSALLGEDLERLTPERDLALAELVRAELNGELRYGIGREADMTVLEMCRYVVLRHAAVSPKPNASEDRFYWLLQMVEAICPSFMSPSYGRDPSEADGPVERALYAPSPLAFTDATALPSWLVARWSDQAPMAQQPGTMR